jgi:hypothetical protein
MKILFPFFLSLTLVGGYAQDKTKTTLPTTVKTTTVLKPTITTSTTEVKAPVVTPPPPPISTVIQKSPGILNPAVISATPVVKYPLPSNPGPIIKPPTAPPIINPKTPIPASTPSTPVAPSGPLGDPKDRRPNFQEVSNAVDRLINNELVKSLFTRQKTVKIEGALGPNIQVQKNVRLLLKDRDLKPFFDKINISDEVFDDKNPDAKVIYYLPQSYHVRYEIEKKEYSFNVFYKTADASEGRVIATAQLYPNIVEQDILIAEKILRKELKKDIQLVPLPLNSTPKISFENFLSTNYNIPETDISTHAPTDIFDPITVSWKMDANSANNLVNLLTNNLEIPGNVYFSPNTDGAKQIPVPFKIKFNDPDTFGNLQFIKDENTFSGTLKNDFEYPIVIESIYTLEEKGKSYEVNKFETKFSKIVPNASLTIKELLKDVSDAKAIMSKGVKQLWFGYSTKTCEECDLGIQEKLLKGTSNKLVKRIEIQVLTPIAATGANSFRLLIKSVQGDPRGSNEVIMPMITIKEDNIALNGGELFILNNDQPSFQYKLIRIDKDANKTESEWISTNDLLLIIGEKTVNDLIKK